MRTSELREQRRDIQGTKWREGGIDSIILYIFPPLVVSKICCICAKFEKKCWWRYGFILKISSPLLSWACFTEWSEKSTCSGFLSISYQHQVLHSKVQQTFSGPLLTIVPMDEIFSKFNYILPYIFMQYSAFVVVVDDVKAEYPRKFKQLMSFS